MVVSPAPFVARPALTNKRIQQSTSVRANIWKRVQAFPDPVAYPVRGTILQGSTAVASWPHTT